MTGAYSHPDSNFYIPRIKGECEKAIIKENFDNEHKEVNKGKQCIFEFQLLYNPKISKIFERDSTGTSTNPKPYLVFIP